jgi:hypothetical protein
MKGIILALLLCSPALADDVIRQKVQFRPYLAKVILSWGTIPFPGLQAHRTIQDESYVIHNPAGVACEEVWNYEHQRSQYLHSGDSWFDCDVLIDKDQITILDGKRVLPPKPKIL